MIGMAAFKNWEKPSLFLLGFILINAYIPGIVGAAIPTGWLFLILVLPIIMFFVDTRITNSHILGLLFIVYSLLSLLWTQNLNIATFFVVQMFALASIFCIASGIKDIKIIIKGLAVGLLVSDVISIFQYYKISIVYTLYDMIAGLFVNQNIYCEVSATILICLIIYKLWWFIPLTLPGIILVHSKGALMGLGIFGMLYLYKYSKKLAILVIASTLFYVALDKYNSSSTFERFDLWVDTLRGLKLFGNGIGSYEIVFPLHAVDIDTAIARPRFAHNDLLQLIYEFGIGSVLFVIMIINVMRIKTDETIILVCIAVISMFNYSNHVPVIAFVTFMVAGYITRYDAPIRNIGNSWGSNIYSSFKRA